MNTFIDCPTCGSEFVIDEAIAASNLRCPDCLQWINSYSDEYATKGLVSSYSSSYSEYYDDYGYQEGYDY